MKINFMINSVIKDVYIKLNNDFNGFIIVTFHTSEGIFELYNCHLKEIKDIKSDNRLYNRRHFNPINLESITILKVLFNEEMDFIVILDNDKVIIIGGDNNFDNEKYNQRIEVFDLTELSNEYINNASNYYEEN